jgi:hypothetical protein
MACEVFALRKFTVADVFAPPCRFQPRRENLATQNNDSDNNNIGLHFDSMKAMNFLL